MIAKVSCASLQGVEAFEVSLEVDFSKSGLPSFSMVGLAEGAVRESHSRVLAALRNAGFKLPAGRITVNLAPAGLRKSGSHYDLPLALGLLASAGIIPEQALDGFFCLGELSLSGEIRAVPGVLPVAALARKLNAKGLMTPRDNAAEGAVVRGLNVYGPASLVEAVNFFTGHLELTPHPPFSFEDGLADAAVYADFAEVKGQEHAKRAIEIAAAGGHNILLMGPPGSGKTMLAQRIPGILPPLSFDEAVEVTRIYSVAGLLKPRQSLVYSRPFRATHHTTSNAGLVGGTSNPKPGEVSLAHRGVLFLDELPEFQKQSLEVLRQPLEDGVIAISRAGITVKYPARIMLVAAMNPCPCGYLGDAQRACTCAPQAVQRYRAKLSGPLLDRIDMHIEVPAVSYPELKNKPGGAASAAMRARVLAARQVQAARYAGSACMCNAELGGSLLEEHCALDAGGHAFMEKAATSLALSARSYTRILRLARTIADMEQSASIRMGHLAEAVNCRALDREQ